MLAIIQAAKEGSSAIALPIPELAPVTSAHLPCHGATMVSIALIWLKNNERYPAGRALRMTLIGAPTIASAQNVNTRASASGRTPPGKIM